MGHASLSSPHPRFPLNISHLSTWIFLFNCVGMQNQGETLTSIQPLAQQAQTVANETSTADVLHGGLWVIRQLMCSGWGVHRQRRMQHLLAAWCSLGQPQKLSDCSALACPWLFHLPRPNHNMVVLRGPSPCCTGALTSSLHRLFPPWREKYTCSSSLPCLIKNLTTAKPFSSYTGREGREGPTMPLLTSPGSILSDVSLCSKEAGY